MYSTVLAPSSASIGTFSISSTTKRSRVATFGQLILTMLYAGSRRYIWKEDSRYSLFVTQPRACRT